MRAKTSSSRPVRAWRICSARRPLGGSGGWDGELADEALGGAGREDGVAGGDGADRGDQVVGLGVFEQEAAGARAQPGVDVVVQVERGQDQHLRPQPGIGDVAGRRDAVTAGHPHVHEHDVRAQRGRHGYRRGAVAGLADHLDVGLGVEDQAEALPDQGVVIGQQHGDHAAAAGSRPRRAVTCQPRGWRGPKSRSPPNALMRSRIPVRPPPAAPGSAPAAVVLDLHAYLGGGELQPYRLRSRPGRRASSCSSGPPGRAGRRPAG